MTFLRDASLFLAMAGLIIFTGVTSSWNEALFILNFGLISAVMALGVNLQWGLAGLFNIGIMGFAALGGLTVVLVSMPPVPEAWSAGGLRVIAGLIIGAVSVMATIMLRARMAPGWMRALTTLILIIGGFVCFRWVFDAGVSAVEAVNPASTGYLGGLGLPVILSWPVGGLVAAGAAWVIGKTALGLRSDYLAIATLGIAEIVISVMKNEDWLARGVKNVNGLPRPVPREIDLQNNANFVERAAEWGIDPITASTLYVKLGYSVLFFSVLIILLVLSQLALNSPWGRMMRAIRDNEVAAEAMGKDVTARHLQVFILGSAICGIAGAMLTTLDGQLTPTSYQPLRYTFLIWVMVIVGGSGNNFGAVLGGILVAFLWVQVEVYGTQLMQVATFWMADGSALKDHLLEGTPHMRLMVMGLLLLLVLRFSPKGLIPER